MENGKKKMFAQFITKSIRYSNYVILTLRLQNKILRIGYSTFTIGKKLKQVCTVRCEINRIFQLRHINFAVAKYQPVEN